VAAGGQVRGESGRVVGGGSLAGTVTRTGAHTTANVSVNQVASGGAVSGANVTGVTANTVAAGGQVTGDTVNGVTVGSLAGTVTSIGSAKTREGWVSQVARG